MANTTEPAVDEVDPDGERPPVVEPTEPTPAAEPAKVRPMHGGWGTQDEPLPVN
jgi:hypothetical protein